LADAVGAQIAQRLGAVLAPTAGAGCFGPARHLAVTLRRETLTAALTTFFYLGRTNNGDG
jgi:hypothetical protein